MPLTQLDRSVALIVLDLQKGIVGLPGLTGVREVVGRTAELARAFRTKGLPVVLVNVTGGAPGRTEAPRMKMEFAPDWAELLPELEQQRDDILVSKQRPGAFLGTALQEILQQREVTQVFLAGVATSNAVIATARSAFDLGYNVVFVKDAMMDRDLEAHEFYLTKRFPRLGEIDSAENVLGVIGN